MRSSLKKRFWVAAATSVVVVFCYWLSAGSLPAEAEGDRLFGLFRYDTRWQRFTKHRTAPAVESKLIDQSAITLVFAVSPDKTRIAYSNIVAPGGRGPIMVADPQTGKKLLTMAGHERTTQCVAFSGNGRIVVSGGFGDVSVWDAQTGKQIAHETKHEGYVPCVACSPNGRFAASGGSDWEIVVWQLPDLKVLSRLKGHTSGLRHNCLVWSKDGKSLLSGSWDGSVRLWDVKTGENTAMLQAGYGRVMSIALSPNADRALASYLNGPDQPVIYWDLKNQRELKRFGVPGNPWFANRQLHVEACDISADGSTALFGTAFGSVIWWDLKNWVEITHSQMHRKALGAVFFDDDDQFAVSVGCDRARSREDVRIRYWRLVHPQVSD